MKALLEDEVAARLKELLPDNHRESPAGEIQWMACVNTLAVGNILVVFRTPGGFPLTHSMSGELAKSFPACR